jgi:hypothetical protein
MVALSAVCKRLNEHRIRRSFLMKYQRLIAVVLLTASICYGASLAQSPVNARRPHATTDSVI